MQSQTVSYIRPGEEYEALSQEICARLHKAGIYSRIIDLSKRRDSYYIQLGYDREDKYWRIRVSNHRGTTQPRYSVRTDLRQGFVDVREDGEHFVYSANDVHGLLLRCKKEFPKIQQEQVLRLHYSNKENAYIPDFQI